MKYWIFFIIFCLLNICTLTEYKRNSKRYKESSDERIKKILLLNVISMIAGITATVLCLIFAVYDKF
ncbi:hypothetical protein SAMN05216469_105139 [Ruminococcus albus]|uniref:Uncharacterized protein n=1 Tax=Ruminococcus albus TaxID=1264 RepID=A0A1H7JPV9_RUMAL|nr:hypothetical protein SAMN05216469_105139 [Ruminococcus albus]